MKLKTLFAISCFVLSFTCLTYKVSAFQPGGGGIDPDPNNPGTSVPFDGGLSLLITAGVGYAMKKAYDKRKEEKTGSLNNNK